MARRKRTPRRRIYHAGRSSGFGVLKSLRVATRYRKHTGRRR